MKLFSSILTFTILLLATPASQAAPMGTTFTYQGRLNEAGQPANGSYGMAFYLYDAPTNGSQLGNLGIVSVPVTNGLFTVPLNFDAAFDGNARWLEISVEASSAGGFTTLSPRQPLTPTPYALFAPNAASATTANSVVASAVSAPQLNTAGAPATGQILAFNGVGLVWTNAATAADAWTLKGNAGTRPSVNFLGTTDDQPLEFWVNNARSLRIEGNTNGAPNLIGGSSLNSVDVGVVGATIGGGGTTNYLGFTVPNRISTDFGTISGGLANTIEANARFATVGGGFENTIQVFNHDSTISGGHGNTIDPSADTSTIAGGSNIRIQASGSTISGGVNIVIQTDSSGSTVGGGSGHNIEPSASDSTIGGGNQNRIQTRASASTIGGGRDNTVQSEASYSTIAGGFNNTIQSFNIGDNFSSIAGGVSNRVWDLVGTIAGGQGNQVFSYGAVGGGVGNVAAGLSSTIPGGSFNTAGGSYSFSTGRRAKANHDGAFVWADLIDADFSSGKTNEFAVRATGGVRFVSGVDTNGMPVAGVSLPAGSGSWSSLSDRNSKTNFAPVNPREVLARLVQVPIQTWNYKTQSESTRHIGPIAQDFSAAFQVGEDNGHIATVDADGVALAAIQGLDQKVDALKEELRRRDAENAGLKHRLEALEKLVKNRE